MLRRLGYVLRNTHLADRFVWLFLLVWTIIIGHFVWSEQLRSLSDDSVSYLIMGQYWSPWHVTPAAITDIYPWELYPPLFGWLLAISDAAWSMPWAHVLVVLLLAAAWQALFRLARAWSLNPWAAVALVIMLSLASYSLIHVQRILSENLYLLLSLLLLQRVEPMRGRWQALQVSGLLALLVLTRSMGLVMVCAYLLQQAVEALSLWRRSALQAGFAHYVRALMMVALPLACWLLWKELRPQLSVDRYHADLLKGLMAFDVSQPVVSASTLLGPQLEAMYSAWYSIWMAWWETGPHFAYIVVSLSGVLGGLGLIWRLNQNKLDAWYVAGSLALLIIWPYPGQMIRFCYVLAPFWLLYAMLVAQGLFTHVGARASVYAVNLLAVSMLLAVLPAVGHVVGRAHYPDTSQPWADIAEFYLRLDPVEARNDAGRQLAVLEDMKRIRQSTNDTDRIMWNSAGYIALLAGRYASYFPRSGDAREFVEKIRGSGVTHIYLSRFDPRRTTLDTNGLEIWPLLRGWTEPVWVRRSADGQTQAVLLRIRKYGSPTP